MGNYLSAEETDNELSVDPSINSIRNISRDDGLTVSAAKRARVPSTHVQKNHPTSSIIREI